MNRNMIISKIFMWIGWVVITGGLMSLLIAANQKNPGEACKDVIVTIKNSNGKAYMDPAEILDQLESVQGSLMNKVFADIKMGKLEDKLSKHQWIRDVELYVDSKNVLHVVVEERVPVARVIAKSGHSFYLDETGKKMSLVDNIAIRLPVITNFSSAIKWSSKDSVMLDGLLDLVKIMQDDPFWGAQIGQIDVVEGQKIELIPVIGNHVIRLGMPENIEEKLHNLYLFYKEVLTKTGMDKYTAVDIQFKGQVVGVKGNSTDVNSKELTENIQALIKQMQEEAEFSAVDLNQQPKNPVTTNPEYSDSNPEKTPLIQDPNSVKTTLSSKPKNREM